MEHFVKKMGWISMITSLVFIILGFIVAYYPDTTFQIISYVLGAVFIGIGLLKIISYVIHKGSYDLYNYELVYGIIAVLLGIVIIVASNMIETLIRVIIGFWIVYSGAMRLGLALKLQKMEVDIKIWVSVLLMALVMLFCGIYIIAVPGIIVATIGVLMIIYGVMDFIEEIIFRINEKDLMKE